MTTCVMRTKHWTRGADMEDHDLQRGAAEALMALFEGANEEADKENVTPDRPCADHGAGGAALPLSPPKAQRLPFAEHDSNAERPPDGVSPPRASRTCHVCPCTSDACDKYMDGENCEGLKCCAGPGLCSCFSCHRVPQGEDEARTWFSRLLPGVEVTAEALRKFQKGRVHSCHFHERDKFWVRTRGGGRAQQLKAGFKVCASCVV